MAKEEENGIMKLLACVAFAAVGLCDASAGTYLPDEGDIAVSVYQTTGRRDFREILTTPFSVHAYTNREPIDVDAAVHRGTYRGLGVSMTDSACWLLSRLAPERRRALLEAVFSPTKGAGLGAVRLNIGSSDYSTALYCYDETPGDVDMKDFSVSRDDRWVFPMVREAMTVNPDIFLFAAPWSMPGWMKTTGNFVDGNLRDGCERAAANYLFAYIRELRARGLDLGAISVQNEVELSTRGTYPSCVYTGEQESKVAKLLAARIAEAGLGTRVWIWDWSYTNGRERLRAQLKDEALVKAIDGIAWHSYGAGTASEFLPEVRANHPSLRFYHTEMGPALHVSNRTEQWWCTKMRDAFENGCETFTGWNLCLDEDGGPLTGPHLCMGLVTVDPETGDFVPSSQYTVFRHVGPFVKKGAEVLGVNGDLDGCEALLFRNPGGEIVLIVCCNEGRGVKRAVNEPRPKVYVKFNGEMKQLPLPYGTWSVTTMVFSRKGVRP